MPRHPIARPSRRRLPEKRDPEFTRRLSDTSCACRRRSGLGSGFRFLYAAFLQEAAVLLGKPALQDLSLQLTTIGDEWREFALHARA